MIDEIEDSAQADIISPHLIILQYIIFIFSEERMPPTFAISFIRLRIFKFQINIFLILPSSASAQLQLNFNFNLVGS